MGEVAKKGWQQYMLQLQHHPLRTKAITAGVLAAISDSISQKLSGIQKLQLRRLLLKVVLLEQLTSSPWNNILFMLYYGLVVEGRTWNQIRGKIKKDYPSVQLTAWMFWPIVGWVNHQYMPLQFRVIFHSCVACCWGIFLNLRARSIMQAKG
ncbi:peroxisomal membrane protein PMP22-like isoform X2 [Telopea speciosissima]|uniref:peroxisomal membrane protein PMP22-like isoform X2 n=1 Tax=Telopea speciosissima TaxID=54955 RepID=UPI001CC6110D|nr:peroxisomal membrane protein PMP22-like isoform X2 [Telopea speciosissima]